MNSKAQTLSSTIDHSEKNVERFKRENVGQGPRNVSGALQGQQRLTGRIIAHPLNISHHS